MKRYFFLLLTVFALLCGRVWAIGGYIDNGDGTVTDNGTGLMWQQSDDGNVRVWTDALGYCEGLDFAGYTDWRLPDIQELRSIVDYNKDYPAIDASVFSSRSSRYWSATTYAHYSDYAWYVNFCYGNVNAYTKTNSFYARCVRGGLSGPFDNLVIRGRVLDTETGEPIEGATVTLDGGWPTSSNDSGYFSFKNIDGGIYTLAVEKSGFHTYTSKISVVPGTQKYVTVPLVLNTGIPAIISVSPQFSGMFIDGVSCPNTYTVNVSWAGEPGGVNFEVNGHSYYEPGTENGASHTFDMGFDFNANNLLFGNTISIVAVNSAGVESSPVIIHPVILESPAWALSLGVFEGEKKWGSESIYRFSLEFEYPREPFEGKVDVPSWFPFLGGNAFGITETQASAKAYLQNDGEAGGGISGSLGFMAAGQTLIGSIGGDIDIDYVDGEGLVWRDAGFHLGLAGKISKQVGVVELIPALTSFSNIPGISWFNRKAKVEGEITPGVDFSLSLLNENDQIVFDAFEGTGETGIQLSLAMEIVKNLKASIYGGGDSSLTLQFPRNPNYFKEFEAKLFAGIKINIWSLVLNPEAIHVWTYPETKYLVPKEDTSKTAIVFEPVQPDFARYGAYNRMAPVGKNLLDKGTSSAETMIIENVYEYSEPALVENNGNLTIAFVYYDPDDPVLQNTEIFTTSYDGTSFSTPTAILNDTRAEFNPQLAVDGNGNIVAVWERIKSPDFSSTELADMAAEMEIV